MTRLLINTQHLHEIAEPDGRGGYVSSEHTIVVTNAIEAGGDELLFQVGVRVSKKLCAQPRDANRFAVGFLQAWLPTEMASTNHVNFYSLRVVSYSGNERADEAALTMRTETEVALSESLIREMAETVRYNSAVHTVFNAAKRRLSDFAFHNTPLGFRTSVSEARQCFQAITDVLDCSATMGGYSSSDAWHAFRCYEDLARRKVADNHNYRVALNQVQRFASGVWFPEVWSRKPLLRD